SIQCGFESRPGYSHREPPVSGFLFSVNFEHRYDSIRHTDAMYPPHVRRDAVSLLDGGLSYSEVSKRLGISRYTLRTWNRQRALVDKYRDHGSCARCEPIPRWPEPHPDYAYLLGLYLGDGCISTTGDPAKQVWSLRIFCADAWPGLTEECVRAFRSLRPSHSVHVVDRAGCKEVCA